MKTKNPKGDNQMAKYEIKISEKSHRHFKDIQTKHKQETGKHKEYSDIVDEIIEKAQQFDTIKETRIHTHTRRNLKPPTMKV